MSLNKMWLGIAIGGGATAVYGKAGYIIQFVNCAHPTKLVPCVVGGVRLGAAIHASCGVSFAVLTGVGGEKDFKQISSKGLDFGLELGVDLDELAKWSITAGETFGQAVQRIGKMAYGELQSWIKTEAGKGFINVLEGDLSFSNSTPSFAMFGTPIGAGLGGGVWYEWQEVCEIGSINAWDCIPLAWRLYNDGVNLWLQVKDIPAKDGSEVVFFGKEFCYGLDGVMHFAEPERIRHSPTQSVPYAQVSRGIVVNNRLQEKPSFQKGRGKPPPGGGVNLSVRSLQGSRGVFYNSEIPAGSTVNMGIGLRYEGQLAWESYTSTQLVLSGNGGISAITPSSDWQY